jgi:hypothetical protein
MLRQTPNNATSASPNNYPFNSHTPPQRSLSVNDTRSVHSSSVRNIFTHVNSPISIIPETTSNVSFEVELPRTHALDASIASLTTFTRENNHKRILTKPEFIQQYFQLIQVCYK